MPSEGRSGKVRNAEEIEAAAEDDSGDTVDGRRVPSDLGAVDGEVGGDGAAETLFDEDFVAYV